MFAVFKKLMRFEVLLSLVLILCFSTLAACSKNVENVDNKTSVTIAIPTTSENERGFDPIKGWAVSEHTHDPLIFSTLFKTDKDLNIINDLATEYSFDNDNLVLNVTIRDDVEFSDGTKLTSNDVAFTITKIKQAVDSVVNLESITDVVVVDGTNLEIKLTEQNPNILYTLSTIGIVKSEGYDELSFGKNPIGSGMFKLKTWDIGQSATFAYNEEYYGNTPTIKELHVLFMDEDAATSAAMGESVDVSYTSSKLSNSKIEGFSLVSVKSNDARGISLPCVDASQCGNDVTSKIEVRQALNLCLDKDLLVKNCLEGYGSSAFSVCDNTPWSNSNLKIKQDIEAAEKLLEDAGLNKDNNGIRCEFKLYYSSNDSTRQALAYEFSNQALKIGIKVNLIGTNWNEIYEHQYSDAVLWGWGTNTPEELCNILKSDGSCNFPQFKSSTVDEYLQKGEYQLAQEAANFENASSWVWLCNIDHLYFVRDELNIGNQSIHPHGHGWSLLNNISEWSWK